MSKFFALMSRMKYIERWGLMRSTTRENIAEHTLEVSMIAHCLALIGVKKFNRDISPESVALKALYHEASEVLTGDLPAPIKYNNSAIRDAYKSLESVAVSRLLDMLPEEFREDYSPILQPLDNYEARLVKAADKLSALIKCIEEIKSGNAEFLLARKSITVEIAKQNIPEVEYFINHFLAAYEQTLDNLLFNEG